MITDPNMDVRRIDARKHCERQRSCFDRGLSCLAVYGFAFWMSLFAVGCATSPMRVSLAQLSWGRSLNLSRDKAPNFEETGDEDGVTVVESDAESESPQPAEEDRPRKEPRRLFGFGATKSSEANRRSEPQARPEPNSWWYSTSPSNSNPNNGVDDRERRRQQEQFAEAEALYREGRLSEAQKLLKPLSKKPSSFWSGLNLMTADPGYQTNYNRVREDALFLMAESYYEQERLSPAKDYYEALLKDYPSTRHLNVSTKKLFKIARVWLGFPNFATSDDITQVNLEDPKASEPPKREKPPHSAILVPNLTDPMRPTFDTPGHALEALKAIWLYDPRGPLADDAIMLTASHHLRIGNYQEADRYFSMLREEYPNSPHLQNAFLLGSHVKLMSYQGAGYDEKQLEDARQLKESTLRLFPNLPEKSRTKEELARIEEARAQRLWELVQLYRRKNKPKAMAIYAEDLLKSYPNSSYAPKAREVLQNVMPEALSSLPEAAPKNFQRPIPNGSQNSKPNSPPAGGPFQRPTPLIPPRQQPIDPATPTPNQTVPENETPSADPNRQRNLPVNFQRPRPNTSGSRMPDTSGRATMESPE